nr:hypothetical protein [Tanacetum cinerariifolium]
MPHETSVARSSHQNGIVERCNRTLIEAARITLIYAQAPLFLWAEVVETACFTQNRSIIRLRHGKTPYELLHNKLPHLSFLYVFGALCYPTNDSENLWKLQQKADIGIFIGYAPTKKGLHHGKTPYELLHNKLPDLSVLHVFGALCYPTNDRPALNEMTHAIISSGLMQKPFSSTPYVPPLRNDWDLLFQPMFDELLNPPPSVDPQVPEVIPSIADNLNVKGTNITSYNLRFQELALLCGRMFPEESDEIERYVGGLPEMIQGNVMSYEPKSMQKAIEFANRIAKIVETELLTPTAIATTTTTTTRGPQRHIKEFPLALSVELKTPYSASTYFGGVTDCYQEPRLLILLRPILGVLQIVIKSQVMSSDSHATITYTSMSSYEVIVNGYFGMPMDPLDLCAQLVMEAPPSPDYIPGPEVPPSPDYIPRPKTPPSRLPTRAGVPRPEMDPEEEDGDDEEFEGVSIDEEHEEESSDNEEEEEEHLAPTIPAPALHSSNSAYEDSDQTKPFEEGETAATPPPSAYHVAARIYVRPHIPMPFRKPPLLPIPLPTSSFPLPLLLPSTSCSESIPEADMPLQKRALLTTPTGRYKVGESSVATAARQIRPALTIDDSRRAEDRLIGKLRRERRYFRTLSTTYAPEVAHSRDYCTQIMEYCQSQEVHTSTLVTQIESLQRDVSTLQGQQIDDEDRVTRHIQHEHAQRDVAPEDGDSCSYIKMAPKQARTTRANPDPTGTTTATEPMTQEAINNLIAQRVTEALAKYKTQRNIVVNGDTSHTPGTGPRTVRPTRECTYKDYLNCRALKFNGTERVIGLTRCALTWWNSHMREVSQEVAYATPWKILRQMMTANYNLRFQELALLCGRMFPEESDEIERYVGGLPEMIQGNVMSYEPKSMQKAIEFANRIASR